MSNRDAANRKKSGKSPDPYLRTFLRQAVAIIAAERGLNEASRTKLRALATQLGLADSSYRAALEKLKLRSPSLGLNRYEKKFVEFLSAEFEKMSGDILTIKSENKVIDLAQRKYQISEVRAHQLIRKTAEEFGVGTISHHDAELFATSLIDDAVGDRRWLRDEDKQRLLHACQKWGMTPEDIEYAIQFRIARNRRQRNKSIASTLFAVIGIVLFGSAVIYGANRLDWAAIADMFNPPPETPVVDRVPTTAPAFPEWFDDRLANQLQQAIASDKKIASHESPDHWQDDTRRDTYAELTDIALGYTRPNETLNRFVSELYFCDPDAKTAAEILDTAKQAIAIFDDQLISTAQLRRAFAANDLVYQLLSQHDKHNNSPNDRSRSLLQCATDFGGADATVEDHKSASRAYLLGKSWRNALQYASNSNRVVVLLPELEKKTSANGGSPAINEIRTNLLFQLLDLGIGWDQIRPSIVASIRQSDLTTSNLWIDCLADETRGPDFSRFVTGELAAHLNLDRNQSQETLLRELQRLRSTNRFRSFSSQIEGSSVVEDTRRRVQARFPGFDQPTFDNLNQIPATEIPRLLLCCMASNNVAISWFRSLDHDFSNFNSIHRSALELSNISEPQETAIRPQPTPFEFRRFSESLAKIVDSEIRQNAARISSIQAIVGVAPKFQDISYSDAVVLAQYLFDVTDKREKLEVERALRHFSNWANLKLAVVDHFSANPDVSESELSELLQGLGSRVVFSGNDRRQIHNTALNSIADEIYQQNRESIAASIWQDTEPRIYGLLKQRIKVLSNESVTANSDCIDRLLDAVGVFVGENSVEESAHRRAAQIIRDSDGPELEKIALANEILADAFLQDGNPKIRSLKRLLRSDNSLNYSKRLLASELLLMSQLNSHRKRWLERIAKQ